MTLDKLIRLKWRNFTRKYRFSLRDQHTDKEVWYMHMSRLNVVTGFLALALILFIAILTTVAYTSVLDLIPGYPGNRSRIMLIENIIRLDSMEREIASLQTYSSNIALILEGKTPVTHEQGRTDSLLSGSISVLPSYEDSLLRAQIERGGMYGLVSTSTSRRDSSFDLVPPVRGVVSTRFDPRQANYGVGIATASNQEIVATEAGTVIMSMWTPEYGYIIEVQHPNNLISIYKHSAQSLKTIGERVRAGEVIGSTGEGISGDVGKGLFVFELWHNGVPVDPQNYIVF